MTAEEIEACVDANAKALALTIAPEHRPGVLRYFALAASMAGQVGALELTNADEPAPIFAPVSPPA